MVVPLFVQTLDEQLIPIDWKGHKGQNRTDGDEYFPKGKSPFK
jgi:hypothetical protein